MKEPSKKFGELVTKHRDDELSPEKQKSENFSTDAWAWTCRRKGRNSENFFSSISTGHCRRETSAPYKNSFAKIPNV